MMNKNFALIALVLGFSVVANVQAADKRGTAKERVAALKEAHPTALDQIDGLGKNPRHAAINALESTLGAPVVVDAPVGVEAPVVVGKSWTAFANEKFNATYKLANDNKLATAGITAGSVVVIGLAVDAIVRREKCSVAQAWKKLFGKSAKTVKYDKVAELIAAKQS